MVFLIGWLLCLIIKKKEIDDNCQIQHLTNKYANQDSLHGNIKLKDAIK